MADGAIGIHKGHRARMREKLRAHGVAIFHTYELLEMLLYYVIPYRDTNPTAKLLLKAHGSLDGVLSASAQELVMTEGVGERCAEFLNTIGRVTSASSLYGRVREAPHLDTYDKAGRLMHGFLNSHEEYTVALALLDSSMRLITVRGMSNGGFGTAAIKPHAFMDAAINAKASVAVVGFIHRYGANRPTMSELATASLLTEELKKIGVVVLENFLVWGDSFSGVNSSSRISVFSDNAEVRRFMESVPKPGGEPDKPRDVEGDFEFLLSFLMPEEELVGLKAEADSMYGGIRNMVIGGYSELVPEDSRERYESFIALLGAMVSRRYSDGFRLGRTHTDKEIRDYLCSICFGSNEEWIYCICKDQRGRVLDCSPLCKGIVNTAGVLPRTVLEHALKRRAASIAIAHNHPSGGAEISNEDIQATRMLVSALITTGIVFDGHYVVAGSECTRISVTENGGILMD